ncbi:uncharacterized protein C8orf48 homolog [Oryctolagus cuniculus]|uniref:Chromosome 8 open reading frame 48 n=1 Tax=Oryctolagus cuniculus TaxID=9986 RepID=G1TNH7_RABIT|nr:uncharacterized protein C8orf48 homolog [Oryctolagus cuniculus]XP_051688484.1 uncharacterized protein C8orf48 homolog [Oryctolagus cuniculus]XP_051688485.1 uncharacterized protein C8orf48 homolog [Oryctolagus cuniculus]
MTSSLSEEEQEAARPARAAMAHFSEETLKSLTDEVGSFLSFSSSDGEQPRPSASGSERGSRKPTPRLEEQDKRSEMWGFKRNENELCEKWISHLKGKERNPGPDQPDGQLQTEDAFVSEEELNTLQTFCSVKINLIHHRVSSKEKKSRRRKRLRVPLDGEASHCPVPAELLNRIYFKNMRMTVEQVAAAEEHISSQCPDCNRKRAELAQAAFLRQKKTLLESLLLQEKIDEHLHTKDVLTRIREAHQGLPRLSDDPKIIWRRLNEKSQIGCRGIERPDTKQKL